MHGSFQGPPATPSLPSAEAQVPGVLLRHPVKGTGDQLWGKKVASWSARSGLWEQLLGIVGAQPRHQPAVRPLVMEGAKLGAPR